MSGRKKYSTLLAESQPHAPIYGDSPNNADHHQIYDPDQNSGQPAPSAHHRSRSEEPQTRQQRPFIGASLSAGYLRTLGLHNGSEASRPHAPNGISNVYGGAKEIQNHPPVGAQQPSLIDFISESHPSRDPPGSGTKVKNNVLKLESPRTRSPEKSRHSPPTSGRLSLSKVPEEMEVPSATDAADGDATYLNQHAQSSTDGLRYYGSVGYGPPRNPRTDSEPGVEPRYVDGVLVDDDDVSSLSSEEEEWLLDSELAKEGLYRGNYKSLVVLYTLVPFSTLLVFVALAVLPVLAFAAPSHSPFPYPPYLPFPIPEVVTAMALWSISYSIRDSLYSASLVITTAVTFPSYRFPKFIPILTSVLSAFLQSVSSILFRQLAVPLLLVPYYSTEHGRFFRQYQQSNFQPVHFPTWHDDAFRRVWWISLGWAAVEAVVGIKQGYENIALYKDVLVDMKIHPMRQTECTTPTQDDRRRPKGRATEGDLPPLGIGALTPIQSAVEDPNLDSTPTQRDWTTRQGNSNPNTSPHRQSGVSLASVPERSDYSASLSSLSTRSGPRNDVPLESVSAGERQPLLKADDDPLALTRQITEESQRLLAEDAVERDLEELIALKTREELEEVYGIPVIRIPVFISSLHRINSLLSSLGVCLILSAAYMKSTFAYHPSSADSSLPPDAPSLHPSNRLLWITLPSLLILQTLLAMMHTPWILPKIGIHTFVYIGLLTSLGVFFGGLGIWEALT